jgi:hypothetical protein
VVGEELGDECKRVLRNVAGGGEEINEGGCIIVG